jgi:hypothetical protein
MFVLTICIVSLLSLFFNETRLFGLVGMVVIISLVPLLLIVPVSFAGIYFYFNRQY